MQPQPSCAKRARLHCGKAWCQRWCGKDPTRCVVRHGQHAVFVVVVVGGGGYAVPIGHH